MTSSRTNATANPAPTAAAGETPWYELISEVPEPPEDAMQQASTIIYIASILMARYRDDPTTLVSEQTNVIYDSAVPGSVIVPDVYVVIGVDAQTIETYRRSYRIEEWGVPPAFVLEVGTPVTARRDLSVKRDLYARMGAQEYWRLDRIGESYPEPLVGERLVDGEYVRLELHTEPDGEVWSRSEALGVDFFCRTSEDGISDFRMRDSASGAWLNTLGDEIAARKAAEAQAQVAEARNRELQAEIQRLRQQLDRQ